MFPYSLTLLCRVGYWCTPHKQAEPAEGYRPRQNLFFWEGPGKLYWERMWCYASVTSMVYYSETTSHPRFTPSFGPVLCARHSIFCVSCLVI